MPVNIRGRHFLKLIDYTPAEIRYLLDLSALILKISSATGTPHRYLEGKNVVLLFEKTSTRTRCAFEVAGPGPWHGRDVSRPGQQPDGKEGVHRRHGKGPRAGCMTASNTAASARRS